MSSAAVVVPCVDLDRAIAACQAGGFRLDAIGPADEPTWAELSRPGLTIVVDSSAGREARAGSDGRARPRLRLPGQDRDWPADHGLAIDLEIELDPVPSGSGRGPSIPPTVQRSTVSHEAEGAWKSGRAGMRYRDLLPDRYGGAYIASHIHIPGGGPVADYVHHHDVSHQLIFCHRGWVRVVYQDQGPPLTMRPGDCVLQPPGIRHQVLESSDDLYVVEVGCPAVHRTSLDHELELPNQALEPTRRYRGQRFVHHVAAEAGWGSAPDVGQGVEQQDTGLARASGGLVSARRLRPHSTDCDLTHRHDFRLVFVTDGSASLARPDGRTIDLAEGSSATIPAGQHHRLSAAPATVLLDVHATDSRGPLPS